MPPAAMILDEFDGPRHPRLDRMVGRFEGEHQERLLVIVDAVNARLLIVDDPKIGRVETGLGDRAHRLRSRKKIGKAEDRAATEARPGSCSRIHASVMTPSAPSEPMIMRSGLGPAPEPGRRRDS